MSSAERTSSRESSPARVSSSLPHHLSPRVGTPRITGAQSPRNTSPRAVRPTEFDSSLSIPFQLVDQLVTFTEVHSQLFCGMYKIFSQEDELIRLVYLNHLTEKEQQNNKVYGEEIGRKVREFKLLRTELKREDPIRYGYQKAEMIRDVEQELLHKELLLQFGKSYFVPMKLRDGEGFTKNRWLTVLFNQHLGGEDQSEMYRKQIIEPNGVSMLFGLFLASSENIPNPAVDFAKKAIEYIKIKRSEIFTKHSFNYRRGKLEKIKDIFPQFDLLEKKIVSISVCLDCYEDIKKLRLGAIQGIYECHKGKKMPSEFLTKISKLEEAHSCFKTGLQTSEKLIKDIHGKKEVFIPLSSTISPVELENLKGHCRNTFSEFKSFSKKLSDFIFLLGFIEGDEAARYKSVFESGLKALNSCFNQRK